jgi:MSHA pilin protein MshB
MKSITAMNAKPKQSGFTIIELVVVILLLGILTATALPRFMDVTDEAHTAVVDAIEGGFRTGTALFRAQWTAEGQPTATAVDTSGFNLFASTLGYPKSALATLAAGDCAAVYNSILQDGRPVAASATVANGATALVRENAIEAAATATTDVVAVLEQAVAIADSVSCTYYYTGQYKVGIVATPRTLPTISYNFSTGVVTRANTFALELAP